MNNTSWLLLVLLQLSCFHCYYSAATHHGRRKHARPLLTAHAPATATSTTVVGSVVVVHSSSSASDDATTAVSGTLVGVRCHDGNGRTVIQNDDVVTDRDGKFHIHLGDERINNKQLRLRSITSCSVSVHLTHPQKPPCVATAISAHGLHHLTADHHNHRTRAVVFSAGAFTVRRPERCTTHQDDQNKGLFFPPVPLVPEPPNVGGVPIPPNPVTPAPPPLVPPVLPAPPSPPSLLPPLVPQPPPSSIVPPLLPPLVNPPPPPPPPQILPPVPLLPPLVPGVPPAASGSSKDHRRPGGNP